MFTILFISIIHFFFTTTLFILWIQGESLEHPAQDYSSPQTKKSSYIFREYVSLSSKEELEIGENIKKLNITHVYFVHGTFVGDDPFDIVSSIERAFPSLSNTFINRIKLQVRSGQNFIARELGNFHPNLIKKLKTICPNGTRFENFTWSSSNHHIARLRGAVQLMDTISKQTAPSERILLYGHSHAGQLFTLMSQLASNSNLSEQLRFVLTKTGIDSLEIDRLIHACNKRRLDFVTLGTPIRYTWNTAGFPGATLLHFINHRGPRPTGGSFSSSIMTKSGDYIQQWAVAGSDSKSPIREDQLLNEELDLILGIGRDVNLLRKNIKYRKRLHKYGEHYLVDFKDSRKIPNSLLTVFGHGVYTKRSQMLWIINESLKSLK